MADSIAPLRIPDRSYLIVQERSDNPDKCTVLYAGEGTFNDWRKKIGQEPESSKTYALRQLTTGHSRSGYLIVRMAEINPIGYGAHIFDVPIREDNTDWASFPIDETVLGVLEQIVADVRKTQQ